MLMIKLDQRWSNELLILLEIQSESRGSPVIDSMLSAAKGDHWKALRSMMSPTFSTGKLKVVNKRLHQLYSNSCKE